MNIIYNKTTVLALFTGAFIASILHAKPTFAQYYSQAENIPTVLVDKKIRSVNDDIFYDNITSEQKLFTEGDQIEFKIVVENKGTSTLNNIKLKDTLPKYLTLLFYPGVYNKTTNIVETDIDKLDPGQSKEFYIKAKISDLPSTANNSGQKLQLTNIANASISNTSDSDEAKYFVTKSISIPSTGANDMAAKTAIVLMVTVSTVGLRKLARGY